MTVTEIEKALKTLTEALEFASQAQWDEYKFKIARDACIQRFKYCIELSWKTSMKMLGSQTRFAKPAIREMARSDLLYRCKELLSVKIVLEKLAEIRKIEEFLMLLIQIAYGNRL
ncbi:MAG TPA: hypothetical protein DCL41_09290 [Bdellovibrionales bacterium]|nr:hypothetical protein [Pseudobdellovibrionaceae bacterium]HAG92054.1 hypothetical protein [Bdellovibrionales bacterium]|tara:strand:- start:995 stop:1339 length:345 start_codon:yes stop_codon:yes gene_type:complete